MDPTNELELNQPCVREQDRFLPIASVHKVMKTAIPPNTKVTKESKECMQECASEFLSFIVSEAVELSDADGRRVVSADDCIEALTKLGFDNYAKAMVHWQEATKRLEDPNAAPRKT